MIGSFTFAKLPQIIFGTGKAGLLPGLLARYGHSVMLVTGKDSFIKTTAGLKLLADLEKSGIRVNHIIVSSEPSPETIDNAVFAARLIRPDVVAAIGGGSVIDAGKAISAMIPVPGSVIEYLEGIGTLEHPGKKIPFVAVPTTAGTGSEATKNAVISRTGTNGFKRSLRHDNLVPDIAVVDPELTRSCPSQVTATTGMDCFTQLLESYLSIRSTPYTDALAVEGLKALNNSFPMVCDEDDISLRAGMSFAALTSGICLANAGLGVVHGFASSIGGRYDIPHGIICGTLMAAANEITLRELRKGRGDQSILEKYTAAAKIICGCDDMTDQESADCFIRYLHDVTAEVEMPGLKQYGVKEEDLPELCLQTDCKNNPVKLNTPELLEILQRRL